MRIISQDGTIDVNYDNGNVTLSKNSIIRYYTGTSRKGTKIAEYSSEEKARKAMDMLRNAYLENVAYLDVEGQISHVTDIPRKLFRFPQDNEIEV